MAAIPMSFMPIPVEKDTTVAMRANPGPASTKARSRQVVPGLDTDAGEDKNEDAVVMSMAPRIWIAVRPPPAMRPGRQWPNVGRQSVSGSEETNGAGAAMCRTRAGGACRHGQWYVLPDHEIEGSAARHGLQG